MPSRSHLVHRIVLLLSAVGVLLVAWWVGTNAIEPVPPPPVPPPKTSVSFDPRVDDIRAHPLFGTLQALFRGKVDPGMAGRTNPFLGATGGLEQLQETTASLGTIEEIGLGGSTVIALSKGAEQGVLALLRSASNPRAYEIRRLTSSGTPQGLANWSLAADSDTLAPVALQEDRSGTIWLFSAGGHTGSIQGDGRPLWSSLPLNGARQNATAAESLFALDGAGRLWLTDGTSVFVGNGTGYERIDLSAQLSGANRQVLGVPVEGDIPVDLRRPQHLQMLGDGRIAVLTNRFVATFPLSLQGGAEITVVPGTVITVEPLTAAVWSVERDNTGAVTRWTRSVSDGSRAYTDLVVLPKQAANTPALAAADTGALYALDYTPSATILWSILDDSWVAGVLAPEGSQPEDQIIQIVPDRDGAVWAVLSQRGLLLARPSQ